MKRLAILLGTEEYIDFFPTNFCHNDVTLLKDTLINQCDYAEQDVVFMLLDKNSEVSPKSVLQEIESLVSKSEPGDTILFYYAGHGDYFNGDSYIILPNTSIFDKEKTAIPLRDISSILRKEGRVNVRIFDACHSGLDVRNGSGDSLDFEGFSRDILTGSEDGWITFAACRADEFSYGDPSLDHGVFTYFLVEAINEWDEGSTILPEILKVKVCEKVAEWYEGKRDRQTPTFNSAVSGNLSIARRVPSKREAAKNTDLVQTKTTSQINSKSKVQSIQERVSRVRKFKLVGDSDQMDLLSRYISNAHEVSSQWVSSLVVFGSDVMVTNEKSANHIPDEIKKMIALKVEKLKLDSIHNIQIERHYEDRSSDLFSNVFSFSRPRLLSIDYIISQEFPWPDCYFELIVEADGYIPDGKLFVYLLPLQVSAVLFLGMKVGFERKHSDINYLSISNVVYLKYEESEDLQKISNAIKDLFDQFNMKYCEKVEQRLKYLEWEFEQK